VTIPRPDSTVSTIREGIRLTTASEAYRWINGLHLVGIGSTDIATGSIEVRAYGFE
jgi:hypothetical protein